MFGIIGKQLERLRARFPGAAVTPLPSGMHLVTVPGVPIAEGWNRDALAVYFVLPVGYPVARPEHFFTEEHLRLDGGRCAEYSALARFDHFTGTELAAPFPERVMWFTHRLTSWRPNTDDLLTYVRTVQRHLAEQPGVERDDEEAREELRAGGIDPDGLIEGVRARLGAAGIPVPKVQPCGGYYCSESHDCAKTSPRDA